ncbi:Receptor-Interacting Serine/Threonine-Protein Kinase 1 [Manis pentadactyla]|nr:Receptor-Interacting Serine/Threonine-Protein Kinase 1 [Manis pentadactyla]
MWRVLVGTSTQISSRSFFSCAAPGDVQWHVGGTALRCAVHWGIHTPQRLQLMPSDLENKDRLQTTRPVPIGAQGPRVTGAPTSSFTDNRCSDWDSEKWPSSQCMG